MSSDRCSLSFADLMERGALEIGDGYRAKNDELGGTGLIFLRAGHVKDTHIDFEGVDRFHHTDSGRFGRKIARAGDVVITTKGNSTGRVAYVGAGMPGFVYSPHLSYLRAIPESGVDQGFLRAWSQSKEFLDQLDSLSRSTDMAPYLSLSDQRRLRITLPPVATQQAVAKLNDEIHDRIALLRETNATLEAIEAFEINPTRALRKGAEAPYLDMASLATSGHCVEAPVRRAFSSGTKFRNGDALLARITPCLENGKTAFVDFLADDQVGWGSTEFIVLRPKAPLPEYLGYLVCRHPPFREHAIHSMSGTSGRQRVQNDVLGRFAMALPNEDVMPVFAGIVSPLQRSIAANHLRAQTLATLRDTLLPRLISGQLRLPEAEAALGAA